MRNNVNAHSGRLFVMTTLSVLLSSCGGGGGGSTSATSQTDATAISGTVASGAALAGETVTITDANGTTVTATTDSNGNYSASAAGLVAPLSISVTDSSGQTLVAVLPSLPSKNTTGTANVTTLTTAQAALLTDTGNPLDLVGTANLQTLKSKVSETAFQQAAANLTKVVADILTANGVTIGANGLDPVRTTFKANGTGLDGVLDNIRLSAHDSNGSSGSTAAVSLVSKADPTTTVPLNTHTADKAPPKLVPAPAGTFDKNTGIGALQTALQTCIKDAQAKSGSLNTSSCGKLIATSYLDNGYTDPLIEFPDLKAAVTSSGSVTVSAPKILIAFGLSSGSAIQISGINTDGTFKTNIQYKSTSPNRALITFPFKLANGQPGSITAVACKGTGAWQFCGNQLAYDAKVRSSLERRTYVDKNHISDYESGLHLLFNPSGPNASNVNAVNIQGPGLPSGGIWLESSAVSGTSNFMTIPAVQPTVPPTTAVTTNSNTNLFRWSWVQQSGKTAPSIPTSGAYATSPISNPDNLPKLFAIYQFTLYGNTGTQLAQFAAMNATPPVLASAGARTPWATLASTVVSNFLTPSGSLAGSQTSVAVSWKNSPTGFPINQVGIFTANGTTKVDGFQTVTGGRSTTSATVTPPSGSPSFPALAASNSSRNIQLRGYNGDEVRIDDNTIYQD